MYLENSRKPNNALLAGLSLASLVLLVTSGFIFKKSALAASAPLFNRLSEVPKQDWYQALGQWLKDCPVKLSVNLDNAVKMKVEE